MTEALLSIDRLKLVQRDLNLVDVHLVHVGNKRFVIAHTDEEREAAQGNGPALDECSLHDWLESCDGPPVELGIYVAVPHEPDAYSESYGADPWDFTRIEGLPNG